MINEFPDEMAEVNYSRPFIITLALIAKDEVNSVFCEVALADVAFKRVKLEYLTFGG